MARLHLVALFASALLAASGCLDRPTVKSPDPDPPAIERGWGEEVTLAVGERATYPNRTTVRLAATGLACPDDDCPVPPLWNASLTIRVGSISREASLAVGEHATVLGIRVHLLEVSQGRARLVLAAGGHGAAPGPPLGEVVLLAANESVTYSDGSGVLVRSFIHSPCPPGARCIWQGLSANVTLIAPDHASRTRDLEPGGTIVASDRVLTLVDVVAEGAKVRVDRKLSE